MIIANKNDMIQEEIKKTDIIFICALYIKIPTIEERMTDRDVFNIVPKMKFIFLMPGETVNI